MSSQLPHTGPDPLEGVIFKRSQTNNYLFLFSLNSFTNPSRKYCQMIFSFYQDLCRLLYGVLLLFAALLWECLRVVCEVDSVMIVGQRLVQFRRRVLLIYEPDLLVLVVHKNRNDLNCSKSSYYLENVYKIDLQSYDVTSMNKINTYSPIAL